MDTDGKIKLITKDNQEFLVDKRLRNYSKVIGGAAEDEPVELFLLESSILKKILAFYESYNYNIPPQQNTVKSSKYLENLGEKNFKYFEEYLSEDKSSLNIDKIKPLIDACFHYGFLQLIDLTLVVLGTEFFCPQTEANLEKYKKEHGIIEISPDEQISIMKEFNEVFISVNKKFEEKLLLLEKLEDMD